MAAVPKPVEPLNHELEALASIFRALCDPARLRIVRHLASEPNGKSCGTEQGICACDLEALTALSQPTVSHHMKCLISAQLVVGEKRGKWVYYRLDPKGFGLVRQFLATTPV